jgi:polyhydroxybutyrate depolymerase
MRTSLIFAIVFVAVLDARAATQPCLKPGTNELRLEHDGYQRELLVRLPDDYAPAKRDPAKRYPVVFGFHGAGGPKETYHRHLEWLVKKHGMISVSPQGLSTTDKNKTAWNGFANHRLSNTDDVGFVAKTIDYLAANACIDRDRVYATGGSSGAIFCFRLAKETDLFAAIAPMRGAMIKQPPVPKGRPKLSILLACGTEDSLYTGKTEVPTEVFYPAQETMALWAVNHGADGCSPTTLEDSEALAVTRYSPADAPYELLLYAVKGSGHKLERPDLEQAIRFMGKFFSRHSKADTNR